MAEEKGTVELLLSELAKAFQPFEARLASGNIRMLFSEMGLRLPEELETKAGFISNLEGCITLIAALLPLVDDLQSAIDAEDYATAAQKGAEILQIIINLVDSFDNLSTELNNIKNDFAGIDPGEIEAFALQLPEKLVSYIFANYLEGYYPIFASILSLVGVYEAELVEGDVADESKPTYIRRTLHFDRFFDLLDPAEAFRNRYDWGAVGLNADLLLQRIHKVLSALSLPVWLEPGSSPAESATLSTHWLSITTASDITPPGLQVDLTGSLPANIAITFPFVIDGWNLQIAADAELEAGMGIKIIPPAELEIIPPSGSAQGEVGFSLVGGGPSENEAIVILNQNGIGQLQVGQISAGIGAGFLMSSANGHADGNIKFEISVKDGKLVIDGGGSDGFLSTILPEGGIESTFEIVMGISSNDGFYFEGSASLEISLPLHIDLAVISIDALTINAGISADGLSTSLGVNARANLGPLVAVVENIGLQSLLDFSSTDKNLGFADIDFKFKPPNGVGLSIDTGVIKGGGYLFFDFEREEYAGALELVFSEWIALKAIGLITTKMPDGSKGFSLLIIITVEFGSGIQLGFGFTLLGVGGILGLNRVVKIDALKDGVRTGAVESVMFPSNVIENAPRIISDLKQFFPVQQDIFLVGPMAKLGWGTPTLISAQLGIILEFPDANITILGVIKVILPDEKADILRLQVNFIGRLEPSNKLLWFYAELYDSRVLFITLEGGFGLLIKWGDQANFVVSAGGFHPKYNPPPLPFPVPPRIAVNILNESYAKVRIEAYFAVTSNSVQFGARVELFFGVSDFNIEGHLGFDALFQFDPFFFSFGLSVSLSVKVFGIGLFSIGFSGLLEGPTPWHIEGKGSISILFFSISVPFEHTWGNRQDTKLDSIAIYPLLEKELKALTNWTAEVPAHNKLLVSLRQLGEAETDQLVLHPVGKLRISQRKMPMNFNLDKVGNQKPSDYKKFTLAANLTGGDSLSTAKVEEQFAIGQYKSLSASEKTSKPDFEPLESGLEVAVAGSQIKTSRAVRRVIRYETIIIDTNYKRHVKSFFGFFTAGFALVNEFLFMHFLKGNAVSKSIHSKNYKTKFQPFNEVIEVKANEYSVAFNSNNKAVDLVATVFSSQAMADQHKNEMIKGDATLKNKIHVIPNTELNKAA